MDRKKLDKWIKNSLDIAKEYFDEAEAAREQSGYQDIDALEQSKYNEGVIDVLEALKAFLDGKKK